ncbi:HK97 family phage prohead protease [Bacteroides cellulosilyticus]|jgi:HK97 family phage prohead protease|uniref:HK97 family phage prohead protease n=1 Tax=Bacteroides cellulosilyticus TaxID=246787 RepID=UPI0018ACD582|nr:HK97 family phage prohead protease [Bacteroides cellulosilyticus]
MEIRSFSELGAPRVTGRTVEGYAVVFNHESKVLFDKANKRFFIEIIENGAITEELLRSCDIKALLEHNRQRMLARYTRGIGSLSLEIDSYGLKYKFEAPNTADGDYAIEMITRGDINGSSFEFYTNEKNVTYSKRDGIVIRKVHKIDLITDVSPVSDPAYTGTDVTVRSIDDVIGETEDKSYIQEINNLRKFI